MIMWILSKVESDEKFILLPGKNECTIGRAGCDLVLKDDLCISRSHAVLHVTNNNNNELELEDLGSKYGTFHNDGINTNKSLPKKERVTVRSGDIVRFGVLKNKWELNQMQLNTMASALNRLQGQHLEKYITELNGRIVDNWNANCTHLTMCDVSVTVKLLYALLEQLPIVNCNYWAALLKTARRGGVITQLPNVEDYKPSTTDEIDLTKRAERGTLFVGKTFVFMNRKHFELYGPIVQRAGGVCKDLNSGVKKTLLTKPNVIVVQYVPSTQSQTIETINHITSLLEQCGFRSIPEYEIGLAIIHCSTEKYCNPSYKAALLPATEAKESDDILATGTNFYENTVPQNRERESTASSEFIVPETESDNNTVDKTPMASIEIGDDDEDEDENMNNQSMPKITVTESMKGQCSQPKRNRTAQRIMFSEDEDDDDLFQFEKPHLEPQAPADTINPERRTSPRNQPTSSGHVTNKETENTAMDTNSTMWNTNRTKNSMDKTNKNSTVKALKERQRMQPLPVKINDRSNVTLKGFLEKSQNTKQLPSKSNETSNSKEKAVEPVTRKRIHLAVSRNSDDDDDDLFNFGDDEDTPSSKKSRLSAGRDGRDNSNDELFCFKKSNDVQQKAPLPCNDAEDDVETEPFVPLAKMNDQSSQPKRKRTAQRIMSSEDEDDDDLFQFKKPHLEPKAATDTINLERRTSPRNKRTSSAPVTNEETESTAMDTNSTMWNTNRTKNSMDSNKNSTVKALKERQRMQPLPVKINDRSNVTLKGFLEKSQNMKQLPSKSNETSNSEEKAVEPVTRKRIHLAVLGNSDDDDDDDLFNFGDDEDTPSSKNSRLRAAGRDERDDVAEDDVETEPFVPLAKTKYTYVIPKPKPLPNKISISGWLSRSKREIKNETSGVDDGALTKNKDGEKVEQEDGDNEDLSLDHKKWLDSLKDCIEVKLCALNLSSRTSALRNDVSSGDTSVGGRKNFKAFVKNRVLHPQQRVIKLMPFQGNII